MRPERQSLVVVCVLLALAATLTFLSMTAPYDLAHDKFTGGLPRAFFEWSALCALGAGGIFLWSARRARTGQPK
jgi:hypothetical protein